MPTVEAAILIAGAVLILYIIFDDYKRRQSPEVREQIALAQRAQQAQELACLALEKVEKITLKHAKTLAIKQGQMVYQDDYGNYFTATWFKEVDYFIKHVLRGYQDINTFLQAGDADEQQQNLASVKKIIFDVTDKTAIQIALSAEDDYFDIDEMDGVQFEQYCTSVLNQYGWSAKVTQTSGDQGIDIVAQLGGVTAVFQCKRYAQRVGNTAVQEIIAGKNFAQADIAAVITNSTFTRSAMKLAHATQVYLLHHSDLEKFSATLLKK